MCSRYAVVRGPGGEIGTDGARAVGLAHIGGDPLVAEKDRRRAAERGFHLVDDRLVAVDPEIAEIKLFANTPGVAVAVEFVAQQVEVASSLLCTWFGFELRGLCSNTDQRPAQVAQRPQTTRDTATTECRRRSARSARTTMRLRLTSSVRKIEVFHPSSPRHRGPPTTVAAAFGSAHRRQIALAQYNWLRPDRSRRGFKTLS